jgi:predicted component of type VI protein secretion system
VEQYKCSNRSKHLNNWHSHQPEVEEAPQQAEELPLQVEAEPQVEEFLEAEEVPLEVVVVLLEEEAYPLNNQHKLRRNHKPLMAH